MDQKPKEIRQKPVYEYVCVCFAVLLSLVLSWCFNIKNDKAACGDIIMAAVIVFFSYIVWRQQKQRLSYAELAELILIFGIIVRIGYVMGDNIYDRSYDNGYFSSNAAGHLGYICNIMEGRLPNSNSAQYYQPPLMHILCAIFIKAGQMITKADIEQAMNYGQIVSCTFSCFTIIAFKNFIKEIGIDERHRVWAMAVASFCPNLIMMANRLNNDVLVTYFMVLCVMNTYRWYKKRDMVTTVCLALSFGLGMMSKVSCGVLAVFTGPVMIYCAVKDFKGGNYKETVKQFAVFTAICLPLALWYPIRNYILFDQPLNYVHRIDENADVFVGNVSWYKRFLEFSVSEFVKYPVFRWPGEASIPMYLLRSAVLGDFTSVRASLMNTVFLISNSLLAFGGVASMVIVLMRDKKRDNKYRWGFFAIWLLFFGSYVQFNISFKYTCTANARYLPLLPLIEGIYISYFNQMTQGVSSKKQKILCVCIDGILMLNCLASAAVYI